MSEKDLESRIEDLPEEQREEFEERIEPVEKKIHDELFEKHRSDIKNQIEDDESELSDFNVVVSGFLERDGTEYTFIRTEPLIHEKERNFDVLIAARDRGIAVLVEIERTLLDRLPSKLSKFEEKMDVVRTNGGELDVDAYFEEVIQKPAEDIDYVLSSQHLAEVDLKEEGAERGLNFVAWLLASHGNRCRIKDFTIKEEETATFDGHTDEDLKEYINDVLIKGVEKQDYVSFTYSSSKYLKLKHMAIALVNRYQRKDEDASWDYQDWRQLFEAEVDLFNFLDEEKRTLFENFIDYGTVCGAVGLEVDHGDLLENEYKIKSSATKDQEKVVDELMEKMAEHRMQDDLNGAVREEKFELVTELEQDHATGGTTLSDFVDEDKDK
jgi:hypothetical protein